MNNREEFREEEFNTLKRLATSHLDLMRYRHLEKAIVKHPDFCWTYLSAVQRGWGGLSIPEAVMKSRRVIREEIRRGSESIEAVATGELLEIIEAMSKGEWDHAIDEAYDLIAICDRIIALVRSKKNIEKK